MSALPPKADTGTQPRNVRFVPKADIRHLLDHFAGGSEQRQIGGLICVRSKPSHGGPHKKGTRPRRELTL